MNAKNNNLDRIQEIWSIGNQTKRQIESLGFNKDRFLAPVDDEDDLIAEGLINRVFRITEEAGRITEDVANRYGFERRAASGVRNLLAHAYGEIDREILWEVIDTDLEELLNACKRYCNDHGIEI